MSTYDESKEHQLIKELIFEEKTTAEIKAELKSNQIKLSLYDQLNRDGTLKKWRIEKGFHVSKVLVRRGDYTLVASATMLNHNVLTSSASGAANLPKQRTGYYTPQCTSYLCIYFKNEMIHCQGCFDKSDRPQKSLNMLVNGISDYEATFDRLIQSAKISAQNVADEFNRAKTVCKN
jgi:hypothetical protein